MATTKGAVLVTFQMPVMQRAVLCPREIGNQNTDNLSHMSDGGVVVLKEQVAIRQDFSDFVLCGCNCHVHRVEDKTKKREPLSWYECRFFRVYKET